MHFFKNSISIIAVMCVCGAAYAATSSRVGVNVGNAAAARRLPSLANTLRTVNTTTTSSSSSTTLLSDTDCIDDYRECMKGDNACGPDFEECTTNLSFHGHMGECFSTLYQCSSTGIQSLFGTSNIGALSTVADSDDETGEITDYTYPTAGSIMGLDINGAAIRNKLSTADCVKKYKRCLNKDDVCGEDFELCTSKTDFRKQAIMCDSTLARCQKEGFQQLFGAGFKTKPSNKRLSEFEDDSNIDQWIDAGATLAAQNAVNTCYKVVDNCFLNACSKNPYRCVAGVSAATLSAAEFVEDTSGTSPDITAVYTNDDGTFDDTQTQTASDVRKFFRSACESTIGSNKYCQLTFLGRMPTKSELKPDNLVELQEQIFDDAYATRNNRNILGEKIDQLVEKFDQDAKNKCIETFKSCTVRSCGGGSGAACYTRVFVGDGATRTINGSLTYNDIKNGCAAIVNTDANCKYMASNIASGYNYEFSNDDAFKTLFPPYEAARDSTRGPVVAALNGLLSESYNDAAIDRMRKQCANVVTNCVKSMCGTDYQNCYRNRNDIMLTTYNTSSESYNQSMNKAGGVLDLTIVQGLCASTVKSSESCEEVVAIAKQQNASNDDSTSGWGDGTVGSAWRNSAYVNYTRSTNVPKTNSDGKPLCDCADGTQNICDSEEGGVSGCSEPVMITYALQQENTAIDTVFREALVEIEARAQAEYKAKLTKEQNICLAQNSGANPDRAYVWAKFVPNAKMPTDYKTKGLGDATTKESNELYNSFCRIKVSLQSEDKDVQSLLDNTTDAYFAVGDAFACGSWLKDEKLEDLSATIAGAKTGTDAEGKLSNAQKLGMWGATALSAIVGGVGMDLLQSKTSLGGLLGTNKTEDNEALVKRVDNNISKCHTNAIAVKTGAASIQTDGKVTKAQLSTLKRSISSLKSVYQSLKADLKLSGSEYSFDSSAFGEVDWLEESTEGKSENKTKAGKIVEAADEVYRLCSGMDSSKAYTEASRDDNSATGWRVALDGIGAVATGVGGLFITKAAMNSSNRAEFTAAQQEWLDSLGKKIHCYIGGVLAGDYGDIISVSVSEE